MSEQAEKEASKLIANLPTAKEQAVKIRKQIDDISDDDLYWYTMAIHSENFESLPERVSRVAKEHKDSMPF